MAINLRPLGFQVAVKLDACVDKTYGESKIIMVTDKNDDHQDTGVVINLGPFAFADYKEMGGEIPVKLGDKVCFNRYAGFKITDPEDSKQSYRIITDSDVWGVYDETVGY